MVIIFSVWKTMIGSAVVSLPWAYQQSGLIVGCLVTCTSFLVSYYTCYLIIYAARKDSDFFDTVRRYYGSFGYHVGATMNCILLTGVCIVYFVIQVQLLYPLTLAIYSWSSGNNAPYLSEPTFSQYSSSHCAIFLFVILSLISIKKDMSIFMKVGSIGVIFIFMLTFFIMYTGFVALNNTEFMVGKATDAKYTDWNQPYRTLSLIAPNVGPLAGIFGLGYFLHPVSLPIVRSAAVPKNTNRDIFLGYLFVFISYLLLGSLGYIGFIGTDFANYFESKDGTESDGEIDQNCLNMFGYTEVPAFILRLAIFLLIFSGYPLLHFLLN